MASLALKDVTKDYPGGVRAVDGASLDIADEQLVVLVGPSGCGKSTTLRLIAGLEEVSSGTIQIDGRIINTVPPRDRDVAMVFQTYALYPHLSVYENMAFGLRLRRRASGLSRAEIDQRVRQAARMLGIDDLLDRKPGTLSGGQQQRVAVGRAIVRQPKVFLFDEPLSNADAKLRIEMRAELKRLQRRLRTTTVYVTHDQEEAMSLGDVIAVMNAGCIQQIGRPLEVYERPANRFVAGFVGTPTMNFLQGRIAAAGNEFDFVAGETRIRLNGRLAEAAEQNVDRDLILGIRPEGITFEEPPSTAMDKCSNCGAEFQPTGRPQRHPRMDVRVSVIEPLGDKQDVHMMTRSDNPLVGRMDAKVRVSEGEDRPAYLDLSRAHLFEADALGRNVCINRDGVTARGR
jgi:multiple sugar transport system ATP-binding protein